MSALDNGRISLAAGCVGIAQGCLDASVAYAKEREAFGKPIAAFQLVQQLLAEMHAETEAARLLTWRAAALADAGKPYTVEAALAKWYASEAAVRAANGGRAGARRLRLRRRIPCGEVPPRRARHDAVRGDEPDPDADRRPRADRTNPRSARGESPVPEAVIASAVRTPIGRAAKGSFVDVRPDDLLAFAIREAVGQRRRARPERHRRRDGRLRLPAGAAGHEPRTPRRAPRRAAEARAGHDREPLLRLLAADARGWRSTRSRPARATSTSPPASSRSRRSTATPRTPRSCTRGSIGEGAIANVYIPMGLTAENVAERYDVSREDMDRFAQRSQERAVAAQESGFFEREIDAVHEGGRHCRRGRRRPAAELDVREARRSCSPPSSPTGR